MTNLNLYELLEEEPRFLCWDTDFAARMICMSGSDSDEDDQDIDDDNNEDLDDNEKDEDEDSEDDENNDEYHRFPYPWRFTNS